MNKREAIKREVNKREVIKREVIKKEVIVEERNCDISLTMSVTAKSVLNKRFAA